MTGTVADNAYKVILENLDSVHSLRVEYEDGEIVDDVLASLRTPPRSHLVLVRRMPDGTWRSIELTNAKRVTIRFRDGSERSLFESDDGN